MHPGYRGTGLCSPDEIRGGSSFTRKRYGLLGPTGPVSRQQAAPHIAMKAGKLPVTHALDQAMLQGVDMDVIDMCGEISLIADQVLPESSLPDIGFAFVV